MSACNMMSSARARVGPQPLRQRKAARGNLVVRRGAERVTQCKDDIIVSPSILSANFAKLGEQVRVLGVPCGARAGPGT
jgi:hypothetical protein